MKLIAQRMDLVLFFQNEGYSELLSRVLMKPYQQTLVAHLKKIDEINHSSVVELKIEQAIEIAT